MGQSPYLYLVYTISYTLSIPLNPIAGLFGIAYTLGMEDNLEQPDQYISLARAAALCGLSAGTLRVLANPRGDSPPRLRTVRLGHDRLTTRRWLHDYLTGRNETNTHAAPLPPGYQAPDDRAPFEG